MNKNTSNWVIASTITFLLIFFLSQTTLFSDYKEKAPLTVIQPNGAILKCFASGDEHYVRLHDENDFTIIKNLSTGFYVYAMLNSEGDLSPSSLIAGQANPFVSGLNRGVKPSQKRMEANRNQYLQAGYSHATNSAPKTGIINNIIIFINLADETISDSISSFESMFNDSSVNANSVYNYYKEVSYNKLSINSTFYPLSATTTVVSYPDSHKRGYYLPKDASNTIGYTSDYEGQSREFALLAAAVTFVGPQIPSDLNIDLDGDDNVDNVCFIISGNVTPGPNGWNTVLWPHSNNLGMPYASIHGKWVSKYDLQLRDDLIQNISTGGVGVLCHEMFHSLGAPDLYHYENQGVLNPVHRWSLMGYTMNPPQNLGSYMKYKYGKWIDSIPEITSSGTYTLNPVTSVSNNCYKIASPNSSSEYFIIEYRDKSGIFEQNIFNKGLLVYRINTRKTGNADGPPDEVYIYRPNGDLSNDGSISLANYFREAGRTQIDDGTDPSCFLSDGNAGGLSISDIGSAGSTISFHVDYYGGEIRNIYGENLSLNTLGKVKVDVQAPSDGNYYIKIFNDNLTPPDWQWQSTQSQLVQLQSGQLFTFSFDVTPNTNIETFQFWFYKQGIVPGVFFVIDKVTHTLSAVSDSNPIISSLSTNSGPVGTSVSIYGQKFGSSGIVKFNGVLATSAIYTDAEISAIVPVGATSGPIVVQTSTGKTSNPYSFNVTYNNFVLSNPRVSPAAGSTTDQFTFRVDYYDADGDIQPPSVKQIIIDGNAPINVFLETGTATNGVYKYGPINLPTGQHSFKFHFENGIDISQDSVLVNQPYITSTGNPSGRNVGITNFQVSPYQVDPNGYINLSATFNNYGNQSENIVVHWLLYDPSGNKIRDIQETFNNIAATNGSTGVKTKSLQASSVQGYWTAAVSADISIIDDNPSDNYKSTSFFCGPAQNYTQYKCQPAATSETSTIIYEASGTYGFRVNTFYTQAAKVDVIKNGATIATNISWYQGDVKKYDNAQYFVYVEGYNGRAISIFHGKPQQTPFTYSPLQPQGAPGTSVLWTTTPPSGNIAEASSVDIIKNATVQSWFYNSNISGNKLTREFRIPADATPGTQKFYISDTLQGSSDYYLRETDFIIDSPHDVSVSNISPANGTSINCGQSVTISSTVTAANSYTEHPNISLSISGPGNYSYTDNESLTVIGSTVASFSPVWNTSGLIAGDYTITINASIDGDINNGNNSATTIVHLLAAIVPIEPPFLQDCLALSSTEIKLNWEDRSNNESGFNIERSLDGSLWTLAGTVGVNVTSFTSTQLSPDTLYYFRVKAFDTSRESSSNVLSAKTLLPLSITLQSPNGGENVEKGKSLLITWTTTGAVGKIKVSLLKGGSFFQLIQDNVPNTYMYSWDVPNSIITGSDYQIKVEMSSNSNIYDISNSYFSIVAAPTLTVTAPNGAESWAVGSAHNITWTSTGTIANVKIELSTNSGTSYTPVIASMANTGSYAWTVPNMLSTTCLVRVSDASNAALNDVSNAAFSITTAPTITVTNPKAGDIWISGKEHYISGTYTGLTQNTTLLLEYSTNNGSTWNTIYTSSPLPGYFWTIPSTPYSTTCLVKISDVSNPAIFGVSAVFTILPGQITVQYPNGGQIYVVGTVRNISWTYYNVTNVKIDYSTDSGINYVPIVPSAPANTDYMWTVPNTPSTNCLVRVSDASNVAVMDVSNAVFSIEAAPTITVTSPNGGEKWAATTSQNITWTSVGITNVKIEYSTNSGSSYSTVIASTANTGSYAWTVPNTLSTTCLVRISDASNAAVNDVSNAVFSIVAAPTLTVTAPNGAENWAVGSAHNITWTSTGTITNVKIELSTNSGTSYTPVIASTANTGSYAWTVSNSPSGTCLIRVSDASNSSIYDVSNGTFTIAGSIPSAERQALIDLYNSTNGASWTHKANWLGAAGTENTWYGVTLDASNSTVLQLQLESNNLVGTLPASLSNLGNLQILILESNQLTGSIPSSLGSLSNLTHLWLDSNQLIGTIPSSFGDLSNLQRLFLDFNKLTGDIPSSLGNLINLQDLTLRSNQLTGSIPSSLGNLVNLRTLWLESNQLTGSIPSSIGNLNKLTSLWLCSNQLAGNIPVSLTNLTLLAANQTEIGQNALHTSDSTLITFLNSKDPDWASTQTTAPTNVTAVPGNSSVSVSWTPITYIGDTGGYRVLYSSVPTGPYIYYAQTTDKSVSSQLVSGLTPGTPYYFVVQTRTNANSNNQNVVDSEYSDEVSATPGLATTVTVTSPNGAESWAVGSAHSITWTSTGTIANVKIELSTNSGSSYTPVIASTANTGSYPWTVPNSFSATCLLRVSDASNASVNDVSNAVFSIVAAPTVTVTAPNGAESWAVGSAHSITWTSTGTIANVKIELSTNSGSSYTPVIASTANTGSYPWTVPNSLSGTCLVRVSDASNSAVNDVSNAVFSIVAAPTVTVTAPNGAESWAVGSAHSITWTSTGTIANVKIELSTNSGSSYTPVIASTANTGSYPWTVPNSLSATCLVRVSDASNASVNDVSNAVFSIVAAPTVTVTAPNGAESWAVGSAHSITWTSTGTIANVKIELSTNSGSSYTPVIASTANTGSYPWTVPNSFSATCLLRVSDASNASVNDVSNAVFSIVAAPTVTVTAPNGAESWAVGSAHSITWTSTGTIANVKIELSTNSGSSYTPVIASTANTGSYPWTVPNSLSGTCLVRVSDASNSAVNDVSNAVFSIVAAPTVIVTAPNGGENWAVGSAHNITWTSSNVTNVKIEYSTNSGSSYTTLIASTAASAQSYPWTVPNAASTTCLVRISDASNAAVNDVSNAVFSIVTQTVAVTAPNGGENWAVGSAHNITWTSSNVTNVKIEYSTNSGSSYTTLVASTAASAQSYPWTVPNAASTTCLVRISDASNAAVSDVSNAVFSIVTQNVTVTAPNGGESWLVGSVQNIIWTTQGSIANVKIEFSTDSGASYTPIIASTTNTGSYPWAVPDSPSATCLVRVSDVSNAAVSDVSNATFSIVAIPTVLSPNGGEMWAVKSEHYITWHSTGASVKIEYSTNSGASWSTLSNSATLGFWPWTVPDTPSATCLVRVSAASNAAIYDVSDAAFSITPGEIKIQYPDGGQIWEAGSTHHIAWTSSNVVNVKIEYSIDSGSSYSTVVASVPNINDYTWTIPNTPSTTCLVRVSDASNETISDVCDAVFTIAAVLRKDDLLGTWAGQGVYYRNSDTGGWTALATPATKIVAGDLDGDGIDDLVGIWPSQGGVWVKYSASGAWAQLSSTADWIAAADMNGDGRAELLGSWAGQGVFWRNNANGVWTQLATPATKIAGGDLDGDGSADLIGIWPSQGGVWVKYSQSGAWALLSSTADWIGTGDMNGDGRDDLLGAWTGQGVFYRNSITGQWVQLATPATMITAGDLDADGKDDLIGIWPSQGGVWVKYGLNGSWAYLSSSADWIATGKMRAANGQGADAAQSLSQGLGADQELEMPLDGLVEGPPADSLDLSANSPGRDGFTPLIDKNLIPEEEKAAMSFSARIPGPGEPGFSFIQENSLFPGMNPLGYKGKKRLGPISR